MFRKLGLIFLLTLVLVLGFSLDTQVQEISLPETGAIVETLSPHEAPIDAAAKKDAKTVVYVKAPSFAYTVVQSGNKAPAGYVVGQYAEAKKRNNIGLIAHNYLAGASFFTLGFGDEIVVTYSDGSTQTFVVKNIKNYQATDPYNYSKPFIQNNGKGSQVNTRNVFNKVYKAGGLTFQTCIAKDGIYTWGLMFVIAVPKK